MTLPGHDPFQGLNNGQSFDLIALLGHDIVLNPGQSFTLQVTSGLPSNFVQSQSPLVDEPLLFTQIIMASRPSGAPATSTPSDYEPLSVYRLADMADENSSDDTLKLADTLVGHHRQLVVGLDGITTGFTPNFKVESSSLSNFTTNTLSSTRQTIEYSATGSGQSEDTLDFLDPVTKALIGQVSLSAAGVPEQSVGLSFDTLMTMLESQRLYVDALFLVAKPTPAQILEKGKYQTFHDLFTTPITADSLEWSDFLIGVYSSINAVLGDFRSTATSPSATRETTRSSI